jgi:hypothetical protein
VQPGAVLLHDHARHCGRAHTRALVSPMAQKRERERGRGRRAVSASVETSGLASLSREAACECAPARRSVGRG